VVLQAAAAYSGWALVLLEQLQLLSLAAVTSSNPLGLWAALVVTQAAMTKAAVSRMQGLVGLVSNHPSPVGRLYAGASE